MEGRRRRGVIKIRRNFPSEKSAVIQLPGKPAETVRIRSNSNGARPVEAMRSGPIDPVVTDPVPA